jgi:hypothetical protein
LFDLHLHAGARRVKSTLGVAAGYEVQTLGCALSYLFDTTAALEAITQDIEKWPMTSGTALPPDLSIAVKQLALVSRHYHGIYNILDKRFSLLVAASINPRNKTLLSALSARLYPADELQISHPAVRAAVEDLEAQRAAALFKAAAQQDAQFKRQDRAGYQPGRGRGRHFNDNRGGRHGGAGRGDRDYRGDHNNPSAPQ